MSLLEERIQRATALLPPSHRLPPIVKEDLFPTQNDAKTRYQDWAFTQGFAIVVEKNDLKNGVYILDTKNTRKKEEGDWVRPASKINAMNCPFRLRITWQEDRKVWQLVTCNLEHSHAMCPDPFVFIQHRERDPDRSAAEALALGMRTSHTKYGQAKRTLHEHGLSVKRKDYYNLQRTVGKRTPETELHRAVAALEQKGFHVRFNEKYLVEGDERSRRIVEQFFFCHSEQIRLARRFVSSFMIQTDATFNTNQLNLPISALVGKSNTQRTFHVAYCLITSESTEAFAFITRRMKDLFLYDDCPGSKVTIGNFSSGLSAEVLRRNKLSRSEAGMEAAKKLEESLQQEGNPHLLQLCSWHAAEAIKKRLITEGYPLDVRKQLVTLIWSWINSPTMSALQERRDALLAKLRPKEQDYLLGYYERLGTSVYSRIHQAPSKSWS